LAAAVKPPRVIPLATIVQNAAFLAIVLLHALRRLLPPY
jgi:hypothetical protein